jgi:hypothetical protein
MVVNQIKIFDPMTCTMDTVPSPGCHEIITWKLKQAMRTISSRYFANGSHSFEDATIQILASHPDLHKRFDCKQLFIWSNNNLTLHKQLNF